jgi:crossover junction endodeoxyribonuclease RuvC|tara:strand:- start:105 stop:593 length:489 start_codon:yes stop_codon:yes gene_type:complete
MKVLGIDPGTITAGYGLVEKPNSSQKIYIRGSGTIKMDSSDQLGARLFLLLNRLNQLIEDFKPDEIGIESPFLGKNVQSAFRVGEARAIVMVAAAKNKIPVSQYAPTAVKSIVTGNGRATKIEVAEFLKVAFSFDITNVELDASDAVAVAICHAYSQVDKIR